MKDSRHSPCEPPLAWVAAASQAQSEALAGFISALYSQALWTLLVTLAAFGVALAFARPISRSIVRLRNHAVALGQGEMETFPVDPGPGELQELSVAFNQMAEEVRLRESALRESEQRWATTLASIGDAVIATDEAGRIAFMNPVAEELTGWTLREASMKPVVEVFNIINEQTRLKVENPVAKVLEQGNIVGLANHTLLVKKDGTEVPIDDSGAPLRDKDGRIMGVVLVFRDITARKQAEEERQRLLATVQRERDRLSALVNSMTDEIWFADAEKKVTLVNPAVWKEFGSGIGDAKDVERIAASFEVYRPDGTPRPVDEAPPLRALRGETVTDQEEIVRTPATGQLRHRQVNAAPVRDPDGAIIGSVSVVRDITERKRAEEALRESEAKYRSLFENMLDGYAYCEMIFDERSRPVDFVYLEVNKAFERLTGLKDVIGKRVTEVIPGVKESHPELFEAYGRVALTGRPEKLEINFTPLGLWLSIAVYSPRKNYFVAVFENITGRKQAEEALKKAHDELGARVQERTAELAGANKELREEIVKREKAEQQLLQAQKLESIGTLTGGVAHDFNNILGAIIINSEMALLDIPGDSGLRSNLDLILQSGLRGKDLVKQMLLFSRKSEKNQAVLTLTPLIKETFKLLRSSLPATIQMKLHLETGSDTVFADPSQIQQVIMNLCTNAAHAMRGTTGVIDISLQGITFGSTDLPEADMRPGDYLVLSVKDTGVGMDEEVKKRIFEPFFTTKPAGEGTGLGLSVVYGIVKSHKGSITVYSEPGRGSIFKVYLPKVETGRSVEAEPPGPILRGNERILFVDDEEFNIKTVHNMLQHLGYKVTALMDSREALKLFSEKPTEFDLVITDQTMPFMTGEDLGKELMRIRPDIPVILCTGYSDLITSEKATALGFRGYMMKPFTLRASAELVRRVLDESKPI